MTDSAPVVEKTQPPALQTLHEVEARHIADVLNLTHGQIGEAAKILGIHRNTLTRKVRRYGLWRARAVPPLRPED